MHAFLVNENTCAMESYKKWRVTLTISRNWNVTYNYSWHPCAWDQLSISVIIYFQARGIRKFVENWFQSIELLWTSFHDQQSVIDILDYWESLWYILHLSPLLFVLVADLLQSIINSALHRGVHYLPLLEICGSNFLIMQYVDDSLLQVLEACPRQLITFKALLNTFADSTGLRVNYLESYIYGLGQFLQSHCKILWSLVCHWSFYGMWGHTCVIDRWASMAYSGLNKIAMALRELNVTGEKLSVLANTFVCWTSSFSHSHIWDCPWELLIQK
jgi:hypothetical protein